MNDLHVCSCHICQNVKKRFFEGGVVPTVKKEKEDKLILKENIKILKDSFTSVSIAGQALLNLSRAIKKATKVSSSESDRKKTIKTDFGDIDFTDHTIPKQNKKEAELLYKFSEQIQNPAATEQPKPTKPEEGGKVVLYEVLKDLQARSDMGKFRYGQRLRAHNGRNSLMDAYQEVLDLAMYLKQRLIEDEGAKNG